MFKSRPLRVFVIVFVILDLVVGGLVVGLRTRTWANARSDRRAELRDRFDGDIGTIQNAIFAWYEAHEGQWPHASVVTKAGLRDHLEAGVAWPVNPADGRAMHPGTGPGDYEYHTGEAPSRRFTYRLTGIYPDGKPYDLVYMGAPGPLRVHLVPGTVMVDGEVTGSGGHQTNGGPNLLDGVSVRVVQGHGIPKHTNFGVLIDDHTMMFDDSGRLVQRDGEYSYEGKVGWWRIVARKTGQSWTALRMQPLITWDDPTRP